MVLKTRLIKRSVHWCNTATAKLHRLVKAESNHSETVRVTAVLEQPTAASKSLGFKKVRQAALSLV